MTMKRTLGNITNHCSHFCLENDFLELGVHKIFFLRNFPVMIITEKHAYTLLSTVTCILQRVVNILELRYEQFMHIAPMWLIYNTHILIRIGITH